MVARLEKEVVVYGKNQVNPPIVTWQFGLKRTRAMRHLWIYESRRKKSHFSLSVLIFLRYEWPWEIFVSQTNGRFLITAVVTERIPSIFSRQSYQGSCLPWRQNWENCLKDIWSKLNEDGRKLMHPALSLCRFKMNKEIKNWNKNVYKQMH